MRSSSNSPGQAHRAAAISPSPLRHAVHQQQLSARHSQALAHEPAGEIVAVIEEDASVVKGHPVPSSAPARLSELVLRHSAAVQSCAFISLLLGICGLLAVAAFRPSRQTPSGVARAVRLLGAVAPNTSR